MLDWLETELRGVKSSLAEFGDKTEQTQTQLWDLIDGQARSEQGTGTLAAQVNVLSDLPETIRALRERVERLQGAVGQDGEQHELLARQLRAEMQSERDERGELRRRAEFAEQASAAIGEKQDTVEDLVRRLQDETALVGQRLEQIDINSHGVDSRLAAGAEGLRRTQGDGRNQVQEVERLDRALAIVDERLEGVLDSVRRLQEEAVRSSETTQEFDALRERFEAVRLSQDATVERSNDTATENEALTVRITELDRALERIRTRSDQHDRTLGELRHAVAEAADASKRDAERFLAFQEKVRRREMSDLEQEVREIRGFGGQHGSGSAPGTSSSSPANPANRAPSPPSSSDV